MEQILFFCICIYTDCSSTTPRSTVVVAVLRALAREMISTIARDMITVIGLGRACVRVRVVGTVRAIVRGRVLAVVMRPATVIMVVLVEVPECSLDRVRVLVCVGVV